MSTPNPEVCVFDEELGELVGALTSLIESGAAEHDRPASGGETLSQIVSTVHRLCSVAADKGLEGLQAVCSLLQRQLALFSEQPEALSALQLEWLAAWPSLVADYLHAPSDPQHGLAMAQQLETSQWRSSGWEQEIIDLQDWFVCQALESGGISPAEGAHPGVDHLDTTVCEDIGQWPETPCGSQEVAEPEADGVDERAMELLIEAGVLVEMLAELEDVNAPEGFKPAALKAALQRCTKAVETFANAAAEADLVGLQQVCVLVADGLQHLAAQEGPLPEAQLALLQSWPLLAAAYAETPGDSEAGEALVNYLRDPAWVSDPAEMEIDLLLELLVPQTGQALTPGLGVNGESIDVMDLEIAEGDANQAMFQPQGADDASPGVALELDEAAQELVDLLRAELAEMVEARVESVAPIVALESPQGERRQALERYAEQVERISSAAGLVGLVGLEQSVSLVHDNMLLLGEQDPSKIVDAQAVLENWPILALGYLQTIHDRRAAESLVKGLRKAQWPQPLAEADADPLLDLLLNPVVATEEQVEPRQQMATPEDMSLEIPGDVNQDLLDTLLRELPSQTEEFTTSMQRIINGGFVGDLDVARRIAHTLKGSGNLVGVRGVANLTHHLEDILDALLKHQTLPPRALADTLMNAADCLEAMSEALLGVGAPPGDGVAVLQEVLDWANRIDREGIPKNVETPMQSKPGPEQDVAGQDKPGRAAISEAAAKEASLRIPAALINHMLRLAGESIISTGQFQEQVQRIKGRVKALSAQHQLVRQLLSELGQLVDIRGVTQKLQGVTQHSEFDSLEMDQYSELHTVTHRLLEATSDVGELTQVITDQLVKLDGVASAQHRIHQENQEIALRTRMLPVKTTVARLQRSVRQAARATSKQVSLNIVGDETLMDSEVLNDLMDPLMHMLRNAVDHGIESPEERTALGKDPMGRIELQFARSGDRIVVRCRDDGKGLDFVAIRRIAEERGLVPPEKALTETELSRLILIPGFSTRSQVTQVSGRGVGMDVIHTRIKEMKGSLHISSQTGKGSLMELGLPVTLLGTHALLVRIEGQVLAVSNRGLEEILYPGAGDVRKMGPQTVYHVGDKVYEARELDVLLDLQSDRQDDAPLSSPVLLIEDESGDKVAVLVQEVLDSRDLVVKAFGHYVPSVNGVMGGAILGDGSVAPVLDLPELLQSQKVVRSILQPGGVQAKPMTHTLPMALVVDDSLSARRSLGQFVRDLGFEVRTAQDGFEAVTFIQEKRPDIILADLEMPRMNGLELTSHVRAQEATKDIPVIMITSRSTDKHRQQADRAGVTAYMTKPFSEDALLQHIETALGGR